MKLLFWLSLTVSLSYYQLAIDELIFFPKKGNSSYIVIVYILAALYSLYYIVSSFNFPRPKNSKLIAEDSIVLQKGIKGSLRKGYAEQLAEELLNINSKQAFAIAITGGWGTGKSTFISFITEKIKADTAAIIVEFHPWKNKGEEAVIKDFFYTLRKQLSPYDDRLGPQINNYLNSLFNISAVATNTSLSTFSKLALKSINLLEEPQGTEEEYNKLRKIIKEIPLPILIIIDDLDRLDSPEIIAVLKLIRNVANFEGLSFITAYDKDYVHQAIKSNLNEYGSHYFLEKIVQMEVSLPVIRKKELFETLLSLFEHKNSPYQLKALIKEEWFKADNQYFWSFLNTHRDIVRFYNTIVLTFPSVAHAVDSEDFFLIHLIKLKHPVFYEELWYKKNDYVQMLDNSSFLRLNGNSAKSNSAKSDKCNEEIFEVLKYLFPKSPRKTKNICYNPIYPLYFTNYLAGSTSVALLNDIIKENKTLEEQLAEIDKSSSRDEMSGLIVLSIKEVEKSITKKNIRAYLDLFHELKTPRISLLELYDLILKRNDASLEVPNKIEDFIFNPEEDQLLQKTTDLVDFLSNNKHAHEKLTNKYISLMNQISIDKNITSKYISSHLEDFNKVLDKYRLLTGLFEIPDTLIDFIAKNFAAFAPLLFEFKDRKINLSLLSADLIGSFSILQEIANNSNILKEQSIALKEFIEAQRALAPEKDFIEFSQPVIHKNLGRYFSEKLNYAPILYMEAKDIIDFIDRQKDANRLYLLTDDKNFIIPHKRYNDIYIKPMKLTNNTMFIAIPEWVQSIALTAPGGSSDFHEESNDVFYTRHIDIDNIKLVDLKEKHKYRLIPFPHKEINTPLSLTLTTYLS